MVSKKRFYAVFAVTWILAAFLIAETLRYPNIGLYVSNDGTGEWQISQIDQLSWAEHQDIRVGDIVASVNGNQAASHSTIKHFGMLERAEYFVLMREGKTLTYEVWNTPNAEQVIYYTLIPVFLLLVMSGFSVFLMNKKPNDPTVSTLVIFLLDVGLTYLSGVGAGRGDIFSIVVNDVTFLAIPILFLIFLHKYFRSSTIQLINPKTVLYLGWINGALIFVDFTYMVAEWGSSYTVVRVSLLVAFCLGMFLCLYAMIVATFKYGKSAHSTLLKIMLLGMMGSFLPFVSLIVFPKLIGVEQWIPGVLAGVFLFSIPITFVYLISTNRLVDVDFIINRVYYYSVVALFPSVFITLLLVTVEIHEDGFKEWLWNFTVIYVSLTAFLYLKEKFRFNLRDKLFTETYNFRTSLDRFSSDLSRIMKTSELEERLLAEIRNVLNVKVFSLIEVNKHLSSKIIGGHPDFPGELIREQLVGWTYVIGEIVDIGKGVLLCVGKKGESSYLLWIGEKTNRTEYNMDEQIWLKTLAQYVSLVYENLSLIEGLTIELKELMENQSRHAPSWFLRFMFHLSEKERSRLAMDLHDSVLQQQFIWYRKLGDILSERDLPPDCKMELHEIQEGILDVIHELRDTCNQLHPPLLREIGIVGALKQLFHQTQLRANYAIQFETVKFQSDLDYEQVIAIYRIIQELLNNACKHSLASKVFIRLASTSEETILLYQDNGIGMDMRHLKQSYKHIGLSGIKERVSSLEGHMYFYSSPGMGLGISIVLPLNRSVFKDGYEWKAENNDTNIGN